jgi:hypothetical protein
VLGKDIRHRSIEDVERALAEAREERTRARTGSTAAG